MADQTSSNSDAPKRGVDLKTALECVVLVLTIAGTVAGF